MSNDEIHDIGEIRLVAPTSQILDEMLHTIRLCFVVRRVSKLYPQRDGGFAIYVKVKVTVYDDSSA